MFVRLCLQVPDVCSVKRTFIDPHREAFPDSKEVEVDLFCEEPLLIGEVTAMVRSIDKVTTFLRKVAFLEKQFGTPAERLFVTYQFARDIANKARRRLQEAEVRVFALRGQQFTQL